MREWWPILLGMLLMYLPTFYDLVNGLWSSEEQMHGPLILALALWLMLRLWPRITIEKSGTIAAIAGWAFFII